MNEEMKNIENQILYKIKNPNTYEVLGFKYF